MNAAPTQSSGWPIIGHQHQISRLRRMIEKSSYPLAMLITGVPGVGRRKLAETFAAASICQNATNAVPCGTCQDCHRIASGAHSDVSIWSVARQDIESGVSKSGAMTIETIRAISASTALRPRDGSRRFVIVDDADTLGDAAQQALLKTLEEVPTFVVMILIATKPDEMLDTVQSRCVEIPLQLVPTATIEAALEAENRERIARLAAGRPGWAIAAATDSAVLETEVQRVEAIEQWIAMSRPDRLIRAYQRGDRFLRQRSQSLNDINAARIVWRDLLLSTIPALEGTVDPTRLNRVAPGSNLTTAVALVALKATEQCYLDLVRNVRPRLAMQAMVNQWPILS